MIKNLAVDEPYYFRQEKIFSWRSCFSGKFSEIDTDKKFLNIIFSMLVGVLKSKIHCVTVTQAEVDYIGSITIDEELMEAADLIENEQVHVLNKRNGERIITYVIKGERGSGVICMNGPAALKFNVGDVVIIISYTWLDREEAKNFKPKIIFPDTKTNKLIK
jgi:aspartate 1-decarboxylase